VQHDPTHKTVEARDDKPWECAESRAELPFLLFSVTVTIVIAIVGYVFL